MKNEAGGLVFWSMKCVCSHYHWVSCLLLWSVPFFWRTSVPLVSVKLWRFGFFLFHACLCGWSFLCRLLQAWLPSCSWDSKVITWSFLINTHLCPVSVPYPHTTCLHRVLSRTRFNNDLWNHDLLRKKMRVAHGVPPVHVKLPPWCTGQLPLELLHSFLFSAARAIGTSSLPLHDTVV